MAVARIARRVTSRDVGRNLNGQLKDPSRKDIFVLIACPPGRSDPWFDADEIASQLGFNAEVIALSAEAAQEIDPRVGANLGVYAGAARVYPSGGLWLSDPTLSRFFAAKTPEEAQEQTPALLAEVNRLIAKTRPASALRASAPTATTNNLQRDAGALVERLTTEGDVERLATYLYAPSRQRPVLLVSLPTGASAAYVDTEAIRREVADHAEVFEVPTGRLTYRLGELIGEQQVVYGGAARVYPVGTAWATDPYLSPLRLVYPDDDRAEATERIIGDVLRFRTWESSTSRPTVIRSGKVVVTAGDSRAVVSLDDGGLAAIWLETLTAGLGPQQLVAAHMKVTGALDDSGVLDVSGMKSQPSHALASYEVGSTVLARVSSVAAERATVELFPGVTAELPRREVTDNPLDYLTDLLSVHEVLIARVLSVGPWVVSLLDVDEADIQPAPSILLGGPPWLSVPEFVREPEPPVTAPTAPPLSGVAPEAAGPVTAHVAGVPHSISPTTVSEPSGSAQVAELSSQIADLKRALQQVEQDNRRLREDVARAMRGQESLRTQLRKARGSAKRQATSENHEALGFDDPEKQFRWDITTTWVHRVHPSDKAQWPLPEYLVGPDFLQSLGEVEGVTRARVLQVAVEILIGRTVRDIHPLRRDAGGDSPPMQRSDGATCFRAPIQQGTSGARRLHYWKLPDGTLELSSVRVHDDMRP